MAIMLEVMSSPQSVVAFPSGLQTGDMNLEMLLVFNSLDIRSLVLSIVPLAGCGCTSIMSVAPLVMVLASILSRRSGQLSSSNLRWGTLATGVRAAEEAEMDGGALLLGLRKSMLAFSNVDVPSPYPGRGGEWYGKGKANKWVIGTECGPLLAIDCSPVLVHNLCGS
jgi:uncharacterized protein (TIGR03382 family)